MGALQYFHTEMKAATSARQRNISHPRQMLSNPGENPISAQLLQAILFLQLFKGGGLTPRSLVPRKLRVLQVHLSRGFAEEIFFFSPKFPPRSPPPPRLIILCQTRKISGSTSVSLFFRRKTQKDSARGGSRGTG